MSVLFRTIANGSEHADSPFQTAKFEGEKKNGIFKIRVLFPGDASGGPLARPGRNLYCHPEGPILYPSSDLMMCKYFSTFFPSENFLLNTIASIRKKLCAPIL